MASPAGRDTRHKKVQFSNTTGSHHYRSSRDSEISPFIPGSPTPNLRPQQENNENPFAPRSTESQRYDLRALQEAYDLALSKIGRLEDANQELDRMQKKASEERRAYQKHFESLIKEWESIDRELGAEKDKRNREFGNERHFLAPQLSAQMQKTELVWGRDRPTYDEEEENEDIAITQPLQQGRRFQTSEDSPSEFSDTASVVSDASSIFSIAPSFSTNSSITSVIDDALIIFADTIIKDSQLRPLYETAVSQNKEQRFIRNHERLLKRFFIDLTTEARTQAQRQAIRSLRGRAQRTRVSSRIYVSFAQPHSSEQESFGSLVSQEVDRAKNVNAFLRSMGSNNNEEVEQQQGVLDDDDRRSEISISDSDSSDSDFESNNLSRSELESLLDFFIKGDSFERFKEGLRRFVHHPGALVHAISRRDIGLLEKLLDESFAEVATGDFSWLCELNSVGYSTREMAELLLEHTYDAPWIFFEPEVIPESKMKVKFHIHNCVHEGYRNAISTKASNSEAAKTDPCRFSSVEDSASEKTESLRHIVQELCGLGGIVPFSRDEELWNGSVAFDSGNGPSRVAYYPAADGPRHHLILRIYRALNGFCMAVSQVQNVKCCCDNFTILRLLSPSRLVEVIEITLEDPYQLQVALHKLLLSNVIDFAQCWECRAAATKILSVLGVPHHDDINDYKKFCEDQGTLSTNVDEALHLCSLAVQFLCTGFVSFIQAHCGALQPFFLDIPQEQIMLSGTDEQALGMSWHVEARLFDLTCMGDMLQSPVLVFSASEKQEWATENFPNGAKFDIVTSPVNLLDTWGPGEFVAKPSKAGELQLSAILIGGGVIKVASKDNSSFHWNEKVQYDKDMSTFHFNTKLVIGTFVTTNPSCPMDENQLWLNSQEFLETLGTFEEYWDISQRQLGLSASQYIGLGLQQTWAKVPNRTLKSLQLAQPSNHLLPFLQASWGLQVSSCTGVARRVTLCVLLSDVMTEFVETLFPVPKLWESLKTTYKIVEAFRSNDLRTWMGNLPDKEHQDLVLTIIQYVLSIMSHTGVDKTGENFSIAWIRKKKDLLRCFKVSCRKESYWARILADSTDCATFAYVTTKCLETDKVKCQGPGSRWHGESGLLETAVCRHNSSTLQRATSVASSSSSSSSSLKLKHEEWYSMGKLDSLSWVKVQRETDDGHPRLLIIPSVLPTWCRIRLNSKTSTPKRLQTAQRLRERPSVEDHGENVLVLTGKV